LIYKKRRITSENIDCNQHVSESSYYKIAIDVLQDLHQELGLNDLFSAEQTAPIVFSSTIEFFREVFLDEQITISVVLFPGSPNFRKWRRIFEIYNQADELSAKIISQGAFFDLRTRKVKTPSLKLYETFRAHNLLAMENNDK
tara:strand:+ start:2077 stop:2505 length:429 start_codon:yes stop_codon:yes gene_type:complete